MFQYINANDYVTNRTLGQLLDRPIYEVDIRKFSQVLLAKVWIRFEALQSVDRRMSSQKLGHLSDARSNLNNVTR